MELQPSWVDNICIQISQGDHAREDIVDSLAEVSFNINEEENDLCINSVLPEDILERILVKLPVGTIIKASFVCKKWNDMIYSDNSIQNRLSVTSQKPWYFMFTCNDTPVGHAFDPVLSKWYKFNIPCVGGASWNLVSSSGLMCFMDNDYRKKLYVCNPINRYCKKLKEPPGAQFADYCALAISVNKSSVNYTVTIVKTKQVIGGQEDYNILSIGIYSSESKQWVSPLNVNLQDWRGGTDSVICDGVLHFVVYLTRVYGYVQSRYGILAYDLTSRYFNHDINHQVISAPCLLTCMRLMNLEEELVMVGGIEKKGRPGVIKGIGIWVLRGKEWEEVSQMPNKLFKGFGEFDDVFASSGSDKLIYIQSYGSPALLMFHMSSKEWEWSFKCPAVKKFPLQLFSGICFQPRLDIKP